MIVELSKKNYYIKLLRKAGFNCFPISNMEKIADRRYQASRTLLNQPINENENYGYIAITGSGNAIIDLDKKERYRVFAENMIKSGYMVIETPHGWHIPVTNLSGTITKMDLFDYSVQDKKIIEIQGYDHYCVGVESIIWDEDTNFTTQVKYENKGTDKIWDARGIDFHVFVDGICKNCGVTARRRTSRSSYKNFRDRFLSGLLPTKGTSNDYFFQASIQCNNDGLTQSEAIEKIKTIYDKWALSDSYSGRPFSNIEAKVREVYENDFKIEEGRPKGSTKQIDRTKIACEMIENRKLYSDVETHEIFENKNGFLEKINDSLIRELVTNYKEMEQADYNSILFKLEGLAKPMPETNKNLIVFKDGVRNVKTKQLVQTDEIADMGFKNYNYLPPTKENFPKKWYGIMFDNVDKKEHPRIKAGLRSTVSNYLDSRISVIHGLSRVGKSTGLNILAKVLDQYALSIELNLFLDDKFMRAKIRGLRLLVFQDIPQNWKNFSAIKALTGEQMKSERGFMQDGCKFENKIKIWASGNYIPKISENEKNAMYTSRLSLIHNTRQEPYPENPELLDEIAKEEGEKIVSWILNLPDEDCKYEDGNTVREEWEKLASPEMDFLEVNYDLTDNPCDTSIMTIVKDFKAKNPDIVMDIPTMKNSLESQGYMIKFNIIKNIMPKVKQQSKTGVLA